MLVIALVNLNPADANGRPPSLGPGLLDSPHVPNALTPKVVDLLLTCNPTEFWVQGLAREIVNESLMAVNHSHKWASCLEWASAFPAGLSTALQGGGHRTRFLTADFLAGHGAALRGGTRQGTGLEVIVHLIIPIAHNNVHAILVIAHSTISLHLGAESRKDDLAHGI